MEDGTVRNSKRRGTPQGGVISPLLPTCTLMSWTVVVSNLLSTWAISAVCG